MKIKHKRSRSLGIVLLAFLTIVLVGPFLIPIRPVGGSATPQELADEDSLFIDVDGLTIHYKSMGSGDPTMILLHGFGASLFSWREVMGLMTEIGTVIAYDRPAFGLTERPMRGEWSGESPYSPGAQVDLLIGLMDALEIERAILVGNSAGGTVAALTALAHPERVEALVLVDPAIYTGGSPGWTRWIFQTPQMRRVGPLFVRNLMARGDELIASAWYDPAKVTPEVIEGYRKPMALANWDKALWELTIASYALGLEQRLGELTLPVLVATGDSDRFVPTEDSIRLASELPHAELVVFPQCGHVPQEECPDAFLVAVLAYLR